MMQKGNDGDIRAINALIDKYHQLKKEISKTVVGQEEVIQKTLIAILCQGHVLLVGVPGLAKTLLVNTVSKALGLKFNRIQFTPDLMPSDIIGTEILDESKKFKFIQGPIFANIILADEINRTPPKTQAALLEAMQEKAVTVSGKSWELDKPFFVLATQNPIEQEGTYPLPEAQLDRFMFNILLEYPKFEEEKLIVKNTTAGELESVNPVISINELTEFQKLIRKIPVADNVIDYAVRLVASTRPSGEMAHPLTEKYLQWGAGPRASQFLILGAKCHAAINGKFTPDIEDVKAVAVDVLRHRIIRNFKAEADGYDIKKLIKELL
ncbi:MAG: AAA family ATPase [Bacteroidales bacterium]